MTGFTNRTAWETAAGAAPTLTDDFAAHPGVVANDAPSWGNIKALFR